MTSQMRQNILVGAILLVITVIGGWLLGTAGVAIPIAVATMYFIYPLFKKKTPPSNPQNPTTKV